MQAGGAPGIARCTMEADKAAAADAPASVPAAAQAPVAALPPAPPLPAAAAAEPGAEYVKYKIGNLSKYADRRTVEKAFRAVGADFLRVKKISNWDMGFVTFVNSAQAEVSTRILGRRTAPLPPFRIPNRVPHGFTPRS